MSADLDDLAQQQKKYWDSHPIGAEIIDAEIGSREFYKHYLKYYDQFYDYKHRAFQYEKYAGKDVLEIGCGLGIDTIKWGQAGVNLTAIDLSATSVNNTKKLFEYYDLKADIKQGNAQVLEFPDESFDVVYAYGVLMHVGDMQASIDEILRVLRPGGEALATLYHRWSWFWLLVKLSGTNVESEEGDPTVSGVFSKRALRKMFEKFSSVEITTERPPQKTLRRGGLAAKAYNSVFVPTYNALPKGLTKNFGWHLVVKAVK